MAALGLRQSTEVIAPRVSLRPHSSAFGRISFASQVFANESKLAGYAIERKGSSGLLAFECAGTSTIKNATLIASTSSFSCLFLITIDQFTLAALTNSGRHAVYIFTGHPKPVPRKCSRRNSHPRGPAD